MSLPWPDLTTEEWEQRLKAQALKFDPTQPRDEDGKWSKTAASAHIIEGEMEAFQSDPANSRREISAAINRTTGEILFRNDVQYEDLEQPRGGGVDDAKFIKELIDAGDGNVLHYHTHPDDAAFSDGDWKVLAWSHMGEMRVVTANHVYTVEKTPKFEQIPWPDRTPAKLKARWEQLSEDLWNANYDESIPVSEMISNLVRKINEKMAEEFGVKFTVRARTKKFASVLKFSPDQARDPKGTATGGRFAKQNRSAIDQKRRDFMALVKRSERQEVHLQRLRVELMNAWKAWSVDTQNRKKPLKPDGAAAKKLDSYKHAKALDDAFRTSFDSLMAKKRAFQAQAKELLKVPKDQRSTLAFKTDTQSPVNSMVGVQARKILEEFREFDGSGAFIPVTFPADKIDDVIKIFGGKNPFVKNADGTFSIPMTLTLGKSEDGRAHASAFGIRVGVGMAHGRNMENQVFHEVAHHIEINNAAVKEAAIAFRESRANQPREVYKLKEVNPALDDDEIAVRGKFPDPYSAKLYPNDISTEMISTGVESYLVDPVGFARDRPEHFNLIFDVMHGKYRPTTMNPFE